MGRFQRPLHLPSTSPELQAPQIARAQYVSSSWAVDTWSQSLYPVAVYDSSIVLTDTVCMIPAHTAGNPLKSGPAGFGAPAVGPLSALNWTDLQVPPTHSPHVRHGQCLITCKASSSPGTGNCAIIFIKLLPFINNATAPPSSQFQDHTHLNPQHSLTHSLTHTHHPTHPNRHNARAQGWRLFPRGCGLRLHPLHPGDRRRCRLRHPHAVQRQRG